MFLINNWARSCTEAVKRDLLVEHLVIDICATREDLLLFLWFDCHENLGVDVHRSVPQANGLAGFGDFLDGLGCEARILHILYFLFYIHFIQIKYTSREDLLLFLRLHRLEDLWVDVHGAYPHAHGLAGFGDFLDGLGREARVLDVFLQLLQHSFGNVVLVVIVKPLQEVPVPKKNLSRGPVSPERLEVKVKAQVWMNLEFCLTH